FVVSLEAGLPWHRATREAPAARKGALRLAGTQIGPHYTAMAGHGSATGARWVTRKVRGCELVTGVAVEDWVR
ncbi:hypothetical protein B1218_33790, partial [Pseudomonas ogarae]